MGPAECRETGNRWWETQHLGPSLDSVGEAPRITEKQVIEVWEPPPAIAPTPLPHTHRCPLLFSILAVENLGSSAPLSSGHLGSTAESVGQGKSLELGTHGGRCRGTEAAGGRSGVCAPEPPATALAERDSPVKVGEGAARPLRALSQHSVPNPEP